MPPPHVTTDTRGEVLVAIMNNVLGYAIARNQPWYRIPIHSVSAGWESAGHLNG
jgi:hypothetical protein